MKETKKISLGVVVAIEIDAVLKRYGKPTKTSSSGGYTVRIYDRGGFDLIVVESGAGEIAAATATQMLIDRYKVDLIVNFGVVGALVNADELGCGGLCVVEKVIHYDFHTEGWLNLPVGQYPGYASPFIETDQELCKQTLELIPDARAVVCASADKFVDRAEDKQTLRENTDAQICEMESAGIVLTCRRCGVPCLLIKAVADTLMGGGKEFFRELERVSLLCFDALDKVVEKLAKK